MNSSIEVRRLNTDNIDLARRSLRVIAEVFDEPSETLSEAYVASLLARSDFWVLAALLDGVPIGGGRRGAPSLPAPPDPRVTCVTDRRAWSRRALRDR